jgi:hypothetical protein
LQPKSLPPIDLNIAKLTQHLYFRYGALSTNLQSANGTPTPKTPTKKGTPRATTATPASRKRARKTPETVMGNGGSGSNDEEEVPAGKKVKAVKSEPGQEVGVGGEEEGDVNFF